MPDDDLTLPVRRHTEAIMRLMDKGGVDLYNEFTNEDGVNTFESLCEATDNHENHLKLMAERFPEMRGTIDAIVADVETQIQAVVGNVIEQLEAAIDNGDQPTGRRQ